MTNTNSVAAEELKNFSQQIIFLAQFTTIRRFQAGSSVEIENNGGSVQEYGILTSVLDTDNVHYSIHEYAFPRGQRVPAEYSGVVYRIDTEGMHPGYARLFDEKSGANVTYF